MSDTDRAVYRFSCNCGRMGTLEGIFVAAYKDFYNVIGKEVHFGEVLGKHSDISVVLEREHFELLTDDAAFVDTFEKHNMATGTNPLSYWDDEEDDEAE